MKMMRMLRMVLTVEMVMVMTRVVWEFSRSLSSSSLWSGMRKYLPLLPPAWLSLPLTGPAVSRRTFSSSSSLSLIGLEGVLVNEVKVEEVVVVVEEEVEVEVVEGLARGLKVALRSSSQGGTRSLELWPV